VVEVRRCLDRARDGVALGDKVGGWVEEPVIGEVEGESGGLRGFHGEPRLGFPLILSLMGAGEQVSERGKRSQSCR
jgi:hypothetical protein